VDANDVNMLIAIESIKRVKARYFRCMDEKQWDEWALVFTRDAHMEVPEAAMVIDGRDAIVAAVSSVLEGVRTVHHGHMPEIEVVGPDRARGIWAMEDYVEFPAAPDGTRRGLRGYGHYREEYEREDREWRIARLRLDRLRIDPL
jgi:uncharacterized protein (TIGR02246 family)